MLQKLKNFAIKVKKTISGIEINQNATVKSKGFLRRVVAISVIVTIIFAIFVWRLASFQL